MFAMNSQASSITTADSTLAKCYDERGHEYNIPTYCWSSEGPASLCPKTSVIDPSRNHNVKINNPDQPLVLKVQVNPGDRNFSIETNTSNSIAELKTLICQASTIVRLFFISFMFAF